MLDNFSQTSRPALSNIPTPYPPPNADERRLTSHLERIEQKLDRIFALLVAKGLPEAETKKAGDRA